jgi:hypothetical protein
MTMRRLIALLALVLCGAPPSASAQTAQPGDGASAGSDVQAAFQFLQRQGTIDKNYLGAPEQGLARVQMIDGNMCTLRCGFHLAVGLEQVADVETEFALREVALNTAKWEIDGHNRGFISFSTRLGTPVFRQRGRARKAEMITFKPVGDWTKWGDWKTTEKAVCRVTADKSTIERTLKAFGIVAASCGARFAPF